MTTKPPIPPATPYPWYPQGATGQREPPTPGQLIAWRHSAWRVIEVRERPSDLWTDDDRQAMVNHYDPIPPTSVIIRPAGLGDDPRARDHDLSLATGGARRRVRWYVYPDEHYPVCAHCGEPTPCRTTMVERVASTAARRAARYELPSICPACGEPVTGRQKSVTYPDNLEVPGGPPVTFHTRGRCHYGAAHYEERWIAVDPQNRPRTVSRPSCWGDVTNHNDGTYECTKLTACPGPRAIHRSYTRCRCPDCHARGHFDCHPPDDARLHNTEGDAA